MRDTIPRKQQTVANGRKNKGKMRARLRMSNIFSNFVPDFGKLYIIVKNNEYFVQLVKTLHQPDR